MDTSSDPASCGACGLACAEGQVCSAGRCTVTCKEGETACDGACIDLTSDAENCGSCGAACDGFCHESECKDACADDETVCGGDCVRLMDDPANCGNCENACADGLVCSGGTCDISCSGGFDACDGSCVDFESNPSHCGGCDVACGATEVCSAGTCGCPEGAVVCGDACVFLGTDAANCGACGSVCEAGENTNTVSCVDSTCVLRCNDGFEDCDGNLENGCETDLNDPASCGSCGTVCRDDQACTDGSCGCPAGFVDCDGICVDIENDAEHCGGCGFRCEDQANVESATCEEGACAFACALPYQDCDQVPSNGCESWTNNDPLHCGACGNACRDDQLCAGGGCECPGGRDECGGICADLQTDPNHCSSCNNACDGGGDCTEGICCAAGLVGCDGTCAELGSDPDHCGGCGISCADFDNVAAGTCEASLCTAITCMDGFADCNTDRTDGCEINTDADQNNCGACGAPSCEIGCGAGSCATVVSISARVDHGCAVLSGDGSVKCWGTNRAGQIGDGLIGTGVLALKPAYVLDPTDPTGRLTGAAEVLTGFNHTCVRTTTGNVKCWGSGVDYDTFLLVERTEPITIPDPSHPSGLLSDVIELASGRNFLCALIDGGTVKCWGAVPDGNTTPGVIAFPTPVLASLSPAVPLTGVTHVAAGTTHACILKEDGRTQCWGRNNVGQLGDAAGTMVESAIPVTVGGATPLLGVSRLALGQDHSCALLQDGTARCWGTNSNLRLGDEDTAVNVASDIPVPVTGVQGATQISAGIFNHTCVRNAAGTAQCWGAGTNAKLGNGATANSLADLVRDGDVSQTLQGVTQIEAGNAHSCALLTSGAIHCWGRGNAGQLGNGTTAAETFNTPVVW